MVWVRVRVRVGVRVLGCFRFRVEITASTGGQDCKLKCWNSENKGYSKMARPTLWHDEREAAI